VADRQQQDRLRQDLGLGGRLSERTTVRLLNHDGSFNVRRNNLGPLHPYNAYDTLLSLTIPRLVALLCGGYFVTNAFFATLYWLCGPGALAGASEQPLYRFQDCPVAS